MRTAYTETVSNAIRSSRQRQDGLEGSVREQAQVVQDEGSGRGGGSQEERRGGSAAEALQEGGAGGLSATKEHAANFTHVQQARVRII